MAVRNRRDPYRAYNFLLEIDGITRAGFRECSGLHACVKPIEYRETSERHAVRKLPGLSKYGNVTLKRGVTADAELWRWCKKAIERKIERKNGSIIQRDETGAEKARWNFRRGLATKWTGPSLNAGDNEVAIETLNIAHEGLKKV